MYAVVSSGGKQYRVEPGSTLTIERLAAEAGATLTFDRVLLIGDGDEVTVGTPVVTGASVSATVLGEELGPKLVIFKFKQKVKYRRRTGHRQHLMRVRIDAINADGKPRAKAKAEHQAGADAVADEAKMAAMAAPKKAAPSAAKPRASRAKSATKGAAAQPEASAETAEAKPGPERRPGPARRAAKPKAQE
jgi:large subunit ribosomal protein L21